MFICIKSNIGIADDWRSVDWIEFYAALAIFDPHNVSCLMIKADTDSQKISCKLLNITTKWHAMFKQTDKQHDQGEQNTL